MGSSFSGPPRKPKDQLIRRNKQPELLVLDGLAMNVPEPPEDWARQVVDEWYDFWDSPLATLVNRGSDMGALHRLFAYKHELYWALTAYRKARIVVGSQGQDNISSMFKAITGLEKVIAPLEDRFGMSPAGRLRLGATLGEASKGLAEMNAALDREVAGDAVDDDDDPRDYLEVTEATD